MFYVLTNNVLLQNIYKDKHSKHFNVLYPWKLFWRFVSVLERIIFFSYCNDFF